MKTAEAFQVLVQQGVLEVREDGTIWRLARRTNSGRKKPHPAVRVDVASGNGYRMVSFSLWGKAFLISAHRAVYGTLVGKIPEGLDVNHKDGDKHNNLPANLELLTRSGNHKHAFQNGLREPSIPEIVSGLSQRAKELRAKGMTFSKIAEELGCSQTTAYRAVLR